jgi:uncharacterized protein YjbI with pentapeptide repeats
MSTAKMQRLNYSDSCRWLVDNGWSSACDYLLENGKLRSELRIPSTMPKPDDEHPDGIEFFRTGIEGEGGSVERLANLTLQRAFICRSGFTDVSMQNTDLSGSFICWNDFIRVDFTGAILKSCDFRANLLDSVNFEGADLSSSDLRHCQVENCNFANAVMTDCTIPERLLPALKLSPQQTDSLKVCRDDGEEPPGG